jgi:hypothetical protein
MSRLCLLKIMELPYIGGFLARLLGIHNMYYYHRTLGYLFLFFILTGAVLWWIVIYHSCSQGSDKACHALYPEGNYFDIRGPPWFCEEPQTEHQFYKVWINYSRCVVQQNGNPGAVLFLREIITFLLFMILITAEFKYPLMQSSFIIEDSVKSLSDSSNGNVGGGGGRFASMPFFSLLTKCSSVWSNATRQLNAKVVAIYKDTLGNNEFEVFIYTHLFITYVIAIAAFFSRFEVFHATAVCWGLFALDKLCVMTLHTHTFYVSKRDSELYEGAIKLTLKKRHWFPWKSKVHTRIYI